MKLQQNSIQSFLQTLPHELSSPLPASSPKPKQEPTATSPSTKPDSPSKQESSSSSSSSSNSPSQISSQQPSVITTVQMPRSFEDLPVAEFTYIDGDETIPSFSAFFDDIPHSVKLAVKFAKHRDILWRQETLDIVSLLAGICN